MIITLHEAQIRAKVSIIKADMRRLDEAIGKYKHDNGKFPTNLYMLTSPVAYIEKQYEDPFVKQSYKYYSDKELALIWSAGPDKDYDINSNFEHKLNKKIDDELIEYHYDPTNGTRTKGDIYRYILLNEK